MVAVRLEAVSMRYPEGAAVEDLSLAVDDGEAVVLLGPSGSGKTTVLRLLAGLEKPSSGDVLLDGVPVTEIAPAERNVAMVFQEDVFYPTQAVRGNIAFPLTVREVPGEEVTKRVEAEARAVGIVTLLERSPGTLSAGHRQLVQLARAMVRAPDLFLIDEPLGGLDPPTRRRLRSELRLLQEGYAVTAVYATHDQEDALVLGDRIAVMEAGTIRQIGTGRQVYEQPADTFVARFVGLPEMAMLRGIPRAGGVAVDNLLLPAPPIAADEVVVGVRPEAWDRSPGGMVGTVVHIEDHGSHAYAEVRTGSGIAVVRLEEAGIRVGDELTMWPTRYHLFDATTGEALYHSS